MDEKTDKKTDDGIREHKSSSSAKEILIAYLPAIVCTLCAVVTTVLYSTPSIVDPSGRHGTVYFDQAFMPAVQFVIIFLNRKFKLGLPYYLIALMSLHAVVSVDLGTSFWFYGRYSWWDSSVHCFFGFLAAATLYYLYPRIKGKEANWFDALVIVLIVLSFAAIWELFEYVASIVLGEDMQDWQRLVAEGKNPLSDTMFDMVVAVIGAAVFFAVFYLIRWIKKIVKSKNLS